MKEHLKQRQINEQTDPWRIGESVWDWIVRKTGIKPTVSGMESLREKELNISVATLRRLKKDEQCSLSRQHIRNELAKSLFKILGASVPIELCYYGYPPNHKYVQPYPRNPTNNNAYGHSLSKIEKQINERIASDFKKVIKLCKVTYGVCHFCQPIDCDLTPNPSLEETQCTIVYLSTHKQKTYGPASAKYGKGFEFKVKLCNSCLDNRLELFLLPVASLLKKLMINHRIKQSRLVEALGVDQVNLSKIINEKIEFVSPAFLKKLYGLSLLWSKSYYREEHIKLLLILADEQAGKISTEEMLKKFDLECSHKNTPWEMDNNLLLEEELICIPEQTENSINAKVISSEFLDAYYDSNEVTLNYEVEYSITKRVDYPTVGDTEVDTGFITIRYILVDVKYERLLEFEVNRH